MSRSLDKTSFGCRRNSASSARCFEPPSVSTEPRSRTSSGPRIQKSIVSPELTLWAGRTPRQKFLSYRSARHQRPSAASRSLGVPNRRRIAMAQIVQPQAHISTLRTHRGLALAGLGALIAATALVLVIALASSDSSVPSPRVAASTTRAADAGPAAGTPSAVAQAVGSERVRSGLSLTTNVPALPREDAGPSTGTPAAVRDALSGR